MPSTQSSSFSSLVNQLVSKERKTVLTEESQSSTETVSSLDAAESTEVSTSTISDEQQKSTTTLPPNLSVFVTPQSDTTATNGGTISSTWKNSDTSVLMGFDRGTGFNGI